MQGLTFVIMAFAFGACVGSFLNVVIYRVPRGLSVGQPKRSFCPSCREQIRALHNIPILSWVALNGRCAKCRASIPISYFLVEVATAALFALIAAMHLRDVVQPTASDLLPIAVDCLVAALIVAITLIDFRHAIIPDPLTVPWLPLLVGAVYLQPGLLRGRMLDAGAGGEIGVATTLLAGVALGMMPALLVDFLRRERDVVDPGDEPESAIPTEDEEFSIWVEARYFFLPALLPSALGATLLTLLLAGETAPSAAASAALASAAGVGAGLLAIYVIRFVFSAIFRREAMGLGDAKFLALAGGVLGAEGTVGVFFLACALGSLPALLGMLVRMPATTGVLIASTLLPVGLLQPMADCCGPGPAMALLTPVPLLGLLFFFRRLRSSDAPMTAVPFGPFLAVATLVLMIGWEWIIDWF